MATFSDKITQSLSATKYDIILAGGGLSGLTLAVELARNPFFEGKKILIIEREAKNTNDRTWCFWAKESEPLPPILHRTWENGTFFTKKSTIPFQFAPYRYCMIRSADFYAWARSIFSQKIETVQAEIRTIDRQRGIVRTSLGDFQADWVLNSAVLPRPLLPESGDLLKKPYFSVGEGTQPEKSGKDLLQHFMGWFIEAEKPVFDPNRVNFMDFRVEQAGQTRFFYVLPFDERRALVEFTLFSEKLLQPAEYEAAIRAYIPRFLGIDQYSIEETEFGVIPMTSFSFPTASKLEKVINIGTAGGFVKASSGYAFLRTQRGIRDFVASWVKNGRPPRDFCVSRPQKAWMDSVMLRVLAEGELTGEQVFGDLFANCAPDFILRFLDEDTSIFEDLKIVMAVPSWPFTKAALF